MLSGLGVVTEPVAPPGTGDQFGGTFRCSTTDREIEEVAQGAVYHGAE
jgi:hypothetical protein